MIQNMNASFINCISLALQNAAGDIWQYVAGPQLEVAQCELIALEGDILRLQLEKLQLKEKKDAKHN
jgi:hypothetical protein